MILHSPIPVTESAKDRWEKAYYPLKLPADFSLYLSMSNGFCLKWS